MTVPKITETLWNAYDDYKVSKAIAEATEDSLQPKIEEMVKNFSFQNAFWTGEEGQSILERRKGELSAEDKVITKDDDMYMASEEDAQKYYSACSALYKAEGYQVEEGRCPILISRSNEVDKAHAFIDASLYLATSTNLGKEYLMSNLDGYKKYLDLTVKLLDSMDKRDRIEMVEAKYKAELSRMFGVSL